MMAPWDDMEDLKVAGEADQVTNDRHEIGLVWQRGMQGKFLAVALRDYARPGGVGELIVASLSGYDALVQVIRSEDDLNEIANATFAFEFDTELLADGAGSAVAAGQVAAPQRFVASVRGAGENRS